MGEGTEPSGEREGCAESIDGQGWRLEAGAQETDLAYTSLLIVVETWAQMSLSREGVLRKQQRGWSFGLRECSTDTYSQSRKLRRKRQRKKENSRPGGGKVRWERKRPELGARVVRIERRGQDKVQGSMGQGLDTDKLGGEKERKGVSTVPSDSDLLTGRRWVSSLRGGLEEIQLGVRDLVGYGNWWRHGDIFRNILVEAKDVGALKWRSLGASVWPK